MPGRGSPVTYDTICSNATGSTGPRPSTQTWETPSSCGRRSTVCSEGLPNQRQPRIQSTIMQITSTTRSVKSAALLSVHHRRGIEPRATASLAVLRPVTTSEIPKLIFESPSKNCSLDPVPTWLVKRLCVTLAPTIAHMRKSSFSEGLLPTSQKHAIVSPRLKKINTQPRRFELISTHLESEFHIENNRACCGGKV